MQGMKLIQPFLLLPLVFTLSLWSASPVPYSGKIDIRGVNYFGEAQFAFSLHDGNGTTHWENGNQPKETIKVTIRNGRYSVLLGGQGMNSLPPELFLNHDKLYLKVEVDMGDGEGLRHLAPDQLITATPRALVADIAKVAQVAEKVGNGSITRNMLSQEVLAQLDANATASPTAPVNITRDMLPADVLADLNNSSGNASPITLSMLAPEVTAKLDQNGSGTSGVVAGSLISVPYGQSAPTGYSLYETPRQFWNWQERPSIIEGGGYYHEGILAIGQNIYIACGFRNARIDSLQNYNLGSNTWQYLDKLSSARDRVATAVLDGKIYVIGGNNGTKSLDNVDIYDPDLGNWLVGPPLPLGIELATAETFNGKIYLLGGKDSHNRKEVLSLDPIAEQWNFETNMTIAIAQGKSCIFEDRIWIAKGHEVFSYDPSSKNWRTEKSFENERNQPSIWTYKNKLYIAGGSARNDVIVLSSDKNSWESVGTLPNFYTGASTFVIGNQLFLLGGSIPGALSGKVFSVNLDAPTNGIYDLYRKDGNASAGTPLVQAEVADGSVTASKIASKTIGKDQISDDILKYLKPEITAQPIGRVVYADSNVSLSVTAEGKYLTYQWKKDGSHLTGENNSTMTITDSNATLHDGNYSVVVSNDFGSVESGEILVDVNTTWSTDGLVGWWKFDETNGTVAYDSSGNGNDGNLTGGPTWATGRIGGALSFDGVDDYVIMPATTDLDLMKLSISTWVYSTNFDQNGFIFEKTADGNLNSQYNLFIQNSELRFRVKSINSGYSDTKVDQSILSGWSFITSSYNSSKRKLFVNGQLVASNDFNETIATNPNGISLIGAYALNSIGNNYFFNGLIDDVRIYGRALSAAEVQALYNLGQ